VHLADAGFGQIQRRADFLHRHLFKIVEDDDQTLGAAQPLGHQFLEILALDLANRIGAALVRTPRLFTPIYAAAKPLLIADPAARPLNRMPNSVDTLEPNDRFVEAVSKLPIARGIPYHSIMGDRGRGDTPNSSDGVVPYWSSHLPGAQSELIVNSDHGAQYNPQAIQEVERILKKNLTVSR